MLKLLENNPECADQIEAKIDSIISFVKKQKGQKPEN